jgi:ribosomal protein S18 acetylase RimI-like enzyme
MTDTINIRRMTENDVADVATLGNEAPELKSSATDTFWSKEQLRDWVKSGDVMLVAEAEGHVVGFQLTQFHAATKVGYLSDIAIHPNWRRYGIGSRLVEEAMKELQVQGANYIYGLTKVENEKIHHLLKKFGFTQGNAFYWFEKNL